MTLRQYRNIKRLTLAIIYCCVFLLFFEIGAIFVINKSTEAADEETCDIPSPNFGIVGNITKVQIGVPFQIYFSNTSPAHQYDYSVYIIDENKTKNLFGNFNLAENGTRADNNLTLSSVGAKEMYAVWKKHLNGIDCGTYSTPYVLFDAVDNRSNSANINIDLTPSGKVNKGTAVNIRTTIKDAVGKTGALYINTGEAGCDINSQDTGCWSKKWTRDIDSNEYTYDYKWETAGSVTGRHVVKVKAFVSEGSSPMTDMKPAYINICDTDGNNCGDSSTVSGDPDNDNVAPVPPVEVSDVFGDFTLSRGSGIGGIIQMIIKLFFELAGALSFISLLVAGIQYITASGDSAKAEKAKKTIIYSIIAIIIAGLSFTIFQVVANTFTLK